MTLLGLKNFFTVVGGSEIDDSKRLLADAVHEACRITSRSDVFVKDIFKRDPRDCPPADIYLAGFPCPAFSKLGRRFGLRDSKKRGMPMVAGLQYIVYHKPPVVLLEQVAGFLEKNMRWLKRCFARPLLLVGTLSVQNSYRLVSTVCLRADHVFGWWPCETPSPSSGSPKP